jgi:CRISPR-associated protein Csd1
MLLQRLVDRTQYDEAGEPQFFRDRPVRWQLALTGSGDLASTQLIDLADPSDKARKNGTDHPVPHATRTVGIAPCIGADDIQYVLGWCDEKSKPARIEQCHASFLRLTQAWADSYPDEAAARAIGRFYASGQVADLARPDKWTSKQLVLISVDGQPVTELSSLRRFWAAEVERRKAGRADGSTRRGLCLVCGREGTLLNTLPQKVPRRLVPLAGNDAALVSGNERIHTYDFSTGLSNAPICLTCGTRAVNSLRDVLSDPGSHLSYGDSRLGWWMLGGHPFDLASTLAVDDPESVRSLVERVRRSGTWSEGADRPALDTGRFCAVTVRGNVARIMVRDWIDMPLERLEANVAAWFADHATDSSSPDRGPYYPLWLLVLSAGRWIPDRDRPGGRYADLSARNAGRPPDTGRQLLRAALLRAPLPSSALAHLVTRIRADRHVDAPRAALLRLILTRTPNQHTEVPMAGLDPDNRDPAYLAGRIFAVLEHIQQRSSESGQARSNADEPRKNPDEAAKKKQVNTSFTDRYFGGAVANPRIALIQGQQLAQAWLKKLNRTRPGTASKLRQELTDLFDGFEATAGLPGQADLARQATFILGYHQQRADSRRRAIRANAAKSAADLQPAPGGNQE